jgi:hypothetical protein
MALDDDVARLVQQRKQQSDSTKRLVHDLQHDVDTILDQVGRDAANYLRRSDVPTVRIGHRKARMFSGYRTITTGSEWLIDRRGGLFLTERGLWVEREIQRDVDGYWGRDGHDGWEKPKPVSGERFTSWRDGIGLSIHGDSEMGSLHLAASLKQGMFVWEPESQVAFADFVAMRISEMVQ